jgi:hypothetical protein
MIYSSGVNLERSLFVWLDFGEVGEETDERKGENASMRERE